MSRVYEALKQVERRDSTVRTDGAAELPFSPSVIPGPPASGTITCERNQVVKPKPADLSRMVALVEPKGFGAERFRALAMRIENMRQEKHLKSVQITSSMVNEGKTLVAANLSITLASHTRSKVLLLEGDLHRPTLASVLGLTETRGLRDWWLEPEQCISSVLYQLEGLPLWFLSAGGNHESPAKLLQSSRFRDAFRQLGESFDWILVDSTPMLPVSDVNLWSRLVDGTLLVIREGVAPRAAVEKGLASLDNPKLIGAVLNAASEAEDSGYADAYYAPQRGRYSA